MNRYEHTFEQLKARRECAFIPFAVAGDPDLAVSERIFMSFVKAGADILEIGYPFSDPVADGPVNQRAALRAIAAGLTHQSFFSLISSVRSRTDVPIGILCYANTLMSQGYDTFCARAAAAGVDSILVADMPPEESAPLRASMKKHNLATVFIVSQLTPLQRLEYICRQVNGFVYVVSRLGPTGVDAQSSCGTIAHTLKKIRSVTNAPLCVGFGLSTPAHVAQVRRAGAQGAIVGSHLVSLVEALAPKPETLMRSLARQVRSLKLATR